MKISVILDQSLMDRIDMAVASRGGVNRSDALRQIIDYGLPIYVRLTDTINAAWADFDSKP